MISYKADLYIIRCITNLHAGSGDAEYGVIDQLVQRDVTTKHPCIFGSSMKGAIREYFDTGVTYPPAFDKDQFMNYVFGSEPKNPVLETGAYRFFSADLLTLPARSTGKRPFYRAYSDSIIDAFLDRAELLGVDLQDNLKNSMMLIRSSSPSIRILENEQDIMIEDIIVQPVDNLKNIEVAIEQVSAIMGKPLAHCDNDAFSELIENLPVIARNYLEDGISQNLWYEQIVPRETRFYTFIVVPHVNGAPEKADYHKIFTENLHNKVIQIGADATVGHGFCHFTKVNLL